MTDRTGRPGQTVGAALGRDGLPSRHRVIEPLPDLVAAMAVVPGGLGVELATPFDYAGVRWTPADAGILGSPIGFRLASELANAPGDEESGEDEGAESGPSTA